MKASSAHREMICSLCNKPLTLLPTDTCTDEHGKPVHPLCYVERLTRKKPESPSAYRLRGLV